MSSDGKARTFQIEIAGEYPLEVAALRALVENATDRKVVFEHASPGEAFSGVVGGGVTCDLLIAILNDYATKEELETLFRLKGRAPGLKILALGALVSVAELFQHRQKIIEGHLIKQADVAEFEEAVRCILDGENYYSLGKDDPEERPAAIRKKLKTLNGFANLTPREIEVSEQMATGKKSPDIASTLNITDRTLHNHKIRMYKKTGANNATEFLKLAIQTGTIRAPEEDGARPPSLRRRGPET